LINKQVIYNAEVQQKYPLAFASLMVAVLVPMVAGVTLAGMALKWLAPTPNVFQMVAGGCVLIVLVPVLICAGAFGWLVLARRIVPRPVAKAFFVYPGAGIFSQVSEWMFFRIYGKREQNQ
jgi:hypothetical protein